MKQPALWRRRDLVGLLGGGLALPALAQFRVEVTGVGLTQLPIAIVPFRGEDGSPQKIASIVQADLERSGQFRAVDGTGAALDEASRPDLSPWRQKNADALAVGSVMRLADGRYDVRMRLWDVVRGQELLVHSYVVAAGDLRLAAHRISDLIYEKLTGEKGVFATRIAYITKSGPRYALWVADADGENAQSAFASNEPIISPAWSPDGRTLAVTLTRDGGSQLYTIGSEGGEPRRLTQSASIDTEPVYSSDGRVIYFVSDRGGAPQIYRMSPGGGEPQRVTFTGSYNISPAISPDGRWLAYISRINGAFKLQVMEMASGNAQSITDTTADESPSFAPNGRMLVYATRQGGREALMTTTLDGKIKARLAGQGGDLREPDWGPFQR